MRRTLTLLVVVVAVALGLAVAPAAVAADGELAVDVVQSDDGSATVAVTHDDVAAAGAPVSVSTAENTSYAGTGEYATDENGTVGLPEPNETVGVSVSASVANHSSVTSVTLEAAENETERNASAGAFGLLVSQFVHGVQDGEDGSVGSLVASFVLENNPAADHVPDHAGPPADDGGNESDETDGGQGPPDHAGGSQSDDGSGGGPPDHAGSGDDAGPEGDDSDGEESDGDDGEESDGDDGE